MQMYYLALVLPDELNKEVHKWKQYMLDRYHCRVGLKSPAHITIIPPFWMESNKEEQFLSDVDQLSQHVQPFEVTTNNFSAFKPRTLFIAVAENEQLNQLKKTAEDFFLNHEEYQIEKENRPFHPHITIATRDLHKKDFYEAWPFFEQKKFEVSWLATGLSVLRHNKKNWEVVHTAPFSLSENA